MGTKPLEVEGAEGVCLLHLCIYPGQARFEAKFPFWESSPMHTCAHEPTQLFLSFCFYHFSPPMVRRGVRCQTPHIKYRQRNPDPAEANGQIPAESDGTKHKLWVERWVSQSPKNWCWGKSQKSPIWRTVSQHRKGFEFPQISMSPAPFGGLCQSALLPAPCRFSLATGAAVTQIKPILSKKEDCLSPSAIEEGTVCKVGESTHWWFSLQVGYFQWNHRV